MKVCEVSSTQTITPPYRTHIKLVVQSFLRCLGTLACIAFLKYLHTLIKNTQFICHNSLVFCKLLKYYVMVLTVTSLFNKGTIMQYSILDWLPNGTVQVFDWNFTPTFQNCNYLQWISVAFEPSVLHTQSRNVFVQTIFHSEFHSDQDYSHSQ